MSTNSQICGRVCSVLSCLAILALITATVVSPAFAATPHAPRPLRPAPPAVANRVTQPVNDSQIVRLSGNMRPEANAKNDRGPLPDGYDLDHILLQLQRSPEQEQELEKLIDQMKDRN